MLANSVDPDEMLQSTASHLGQLFAVWVNYSKTCLKRPLKKRQCKGLNTK